MGISPGGSFDDVLDGNYLSAQVTINTTESEVKVGASRLADRQEVLIFNGGNQTIYFGPTGVSDTNGIPIESQETVNLPFGDKIAVYLVTKTGSNTKVVIQELA